MCEDELTRCCCSSEKMSCGAVVRKRVASQLSVSGVADLGVVRWSWLCAAKWAKHALVTGQDQNTPHLYFI